MALKFYHLPYLPLRITSHFGNRHTGIVGATSNHKGIDIGADKSKCKTQTYGGPVYAVLPGIVVKSYYSDARGHVVIIDHGIIDGSDVKTLYQHLYGKGLAVGTKVEAGQEIGIMGNTGTSAQLHLHFELLINDIPVDPDKYLLEVKPVDEDRVRAIIKEILRGAGTEVSAWAEDSWKKATEEGITDGARPGGYCTREQVVTMIERAVK